MITSLPTFPPAPAADPRGSTGPSQTNPGALLASVLRARDDWADVARFDADRRWYARVGEHAGHEVWLLSWLPGQETELHDHGRASGAFAVVSGALTELTIRGRGPSLSTEWVRWTANETRRFDSRHVHQIRNDTEEPAVSLHVYTPALTSMTRYALTASGLQAVGVDEAGVSW